MACSTCLCLGDGKSPKILFKIRSYTITEKLLESAKLAGKEVNAGLASVNHGKPIELLSADPALYF